MSVPLRVLYLEDQPDDIKLLAHELRRAGYEPVGERVETEEEFLARLNPGLDAILSDYSLPGFDGLAALRLVKERGLDVPFIFVSGTIGEDVAVAALHQGADDYVLKDRLSRLGPAVERAVRYRRLRQEKARADRKVAQLAAIINSTQDAVYSMTLDGRISSWNASAARLYGYTAAEALGQPISLIVPPDRAAEADDILRRVTQRETVPPLDTVRLRKDGTRLDVALTVSPILDEQGRVVEVSVIARDITERIQVERALRENEERFRNLVFALPAAVYTTDREGRLTLFNEAAVKLWGRRPEIGKDRWCGSWRIYRTDGSALPLEQCPLAVTLREGHPVRGQEIIVERPDGTRAAVLPHPETLWGVCGEVVGAVNMLVDLTPVKQLEEQYRQAQKMEAIGRLAGGVAHDFNNLLTVITGYSEIALSELPLGHRLRELLAEVRKAGERAAGLTRQLLAFSRKQVLQPVVLDLNGLISETNKMLRRLIGEDVDIVTDLAPSLGQVNADPGQIEQVILNLVVNAKDAMPSGGRLTIATRNATLAASPESATGNLTPGPYVLLAVQDTGCGMDEATKARIFEPFFTTKELGKGTGLGLATVYGIVKQSQGHIEGHSAPGRGTTFNIYFPRTDGAVGKSQSPPDLYKMPAGTETVLLVEDEDGVRSLACLALRSCGYTVLEGCCGQDALEILEQHSGPIDLLVTDVVMPQMSGRQLADRVRARYPAARVLYLSGHTEDAVIHHGVVEGQTPFLQKPFTAATLARKVREVLDGGASKDGARKPASGGA
jgi:PAS domain S-box-containing protein